MKTRRNNGFSMVEIVISIAIFGVLMVPIVNAIIAAIHQSDSSKEMQYRNQFAQSMLEYAKEDSIDNIKNNKYLESIGAYDVESSESTGTTGQYTIKDSMGNSKQVTAPFETYTMKGSINLGTKQRKYSYVMEISNEYYAEKEKEAAENGTDYVNPNNLALGVVEDIDYSKVALINGTIANYDAAVTNAFMTRKLQIMKLRNPGKFEQFLNQIQVSNPFYKDQVKREIIIKISDKVEAGKKEYSVVCKLRYTDDSKMAFDDGGTLHNALASEGLDVIEYIPYSTTFDELPNIYLMYNVCLYNGIYSPDDYIFFDLDDLSDDEDVNAFIVETAATYSSDIRGVLEKEIRENKELDEDARQSLVDALNNRVLYNNDILSGAVDRNDAVRIHIAAKGKTTKKENGKTVARLNLYHNFDTDVEDADAYKTKGNKKNTNVDISSDITSGDGSKYEKLDGKANVDKLDKATEESRGLYRVKVWISKGEKNEVDTKQDPIISGTKGAGES